MAPRVLHLSTYAGGGGAGRAAAALNKALQDTGVDSRLLSAHGTRFKAARAADRALWRLQRSPTKTWRSPARFGSLTAAEINASSTDIVNLHWVNDGFMSIEEIGKITKPLVMSMYDMWPFCGSEHYGVDQPDARWRTGYTKENRPTCESGWDLDRDTWKRKRRHWSNFHVIPASSWLTESTRQSALLSHLPITRIPHAVDARTFSSMDKIAAREHLGIHTRDPLIAFFSSAGALDPRKGFDLLVKSMHEVRAKFPNAKVLFVGPKPDSSQLPADLNIIPLGPVRGDNELVKAYSAADVLAVPSREDNMPLTAMEAHMCGRPVVAFNVGGLSDIVQHGETGFLASPLDPSDFSLGITQALSDADSPQQWGANARQRAKTYWGHEAVAREYGIAYERVLDSFHKNQHPHQNPSV